MVDRSLTNRQLVDWFSEVTRERPDLAPTGLHPRILRYRSCLIFAEASQWSDMFKL